MASLRRNFLVAWDSQEPVKVSTSARDVVNAGTYAGTDPVAATFGLLYAALVRHGHDVPPYEEWLDLVDEVQDEGTVVADVPGPTSGAPSDGEQLLLRASPESPPSTGSTGPTTD